MTMGALFMLDSLGAIDMGARAKYSASRAVDGDTATRWSSSFSDPQWIAVDLGAKQEITRVRLNWEAAHATAYQIQVSDDGATWTTALDVTDGRGGIEEHDLAASGRYVRLNGTKRATQWGYSLRELEVYGRDKEPLSRGKDGDGLVAREHGLLAAVLAGAARGRGPARADRPQGSRQPGDGCVLTGTGLVLQCRNLGLLPWSFNETVAVLLILTGAILVLQALRGKGGSSVGVACGHGRDKGNPIPDLDIWRTPA